MTENINQRLRKADELLAAGRFPEAEAAFLRILADAPHATYANLRVSEVRMAMGRFRDARAAALDAEASLRQARRWDALPFVSMCLLGFDERDRIRQLILDADWTQPAVLSQSPVLSQHLWLCDAYDDALALIAQASQRVPPNPLLLYSRANALRYSGRMEEATLELERCLALSPGHPQAHWTLAFHEKSAQPGSRIDRIRRAKGMLGADDPGQVFLDYALFKEFDDAGDTDQAWIALERGMRAKRASIHYDAAAQAAAIDGLVQGTVRERAPTQEPEPAGHVPIFVVGLPRTGTTLLERILSNHVDVAGGGELGDFGQAVNWEIDGYAGNPPAPDAQARIAAVHAGWLGQRYLARTARLAGGKPFLTDKNPSNVFHAETITAALPRAKMLCLVRDPMDACFSNLKELFPGHGYGYSYDFAEMAAQQRGFSELVEALQHRQPQSFSVVRYEDLAADAESTARRVAALCGLPEQERLWDIAANAAPVLTASNAQVRQPVHAGNIGAWRRYERQLAPLAALLGSA